MTVQEIGQATGAGFETAKSRLRYAYAKAALAIDGFEADMTLKDTGSAPDPKSIAFIAPLRRRSERRDRSAYPSAARAEIGLRRNRDPGRPWWKRWCRLFPPSLSRSWVSR